MHHIHKTEAIVLKTRNTKESDKLVYLFTKDYGFMIARAIGIRKLSSKLRYILDIGSILNINLVHGKSMFQLTSATTLFDTGLIFKNKEKRIVYANLLGVLYRLYRGEEENTELFEDVLDSFKFFRDMEIDYEKIKSFEIAFVINLLSQLGYWDLSSGFVIKPYISESLDYVTKNRPELVSKINQILKETQL